jgi:hypothetical protein
MKELLQFMQIRSSVQKEPEVYSFTFDGQTEVKILSGQAGHLDILVLSLPPLNTAGSQAALLSLLHLNYYTFDGPCLSIGRDPSSGKICLWSRQSLAGMDLQKLVDLLHHVLARASVAQQHLQAKAANTPTVKRHARGFNVSSHALLNKNI